MMTIVL